MTFNRFALEINLERFKSKYDNARGQFEAYSGGRGPGELGNKTSEHNERTKKNRRTFAEVQQVSVYDRDTTDATQGVAANRIMPTYAELSEVAEKLEAYVRKLDGLPDKLPDVNLGVNYSQGMPMRPEDGGDSRSERSAWKMPIEQLSNRISKQEDLVRKWESRYSLHVEQKDRPRASKAKATLVKARKRLEAAQAILAERLQPKVSE